MASTAVYRWVCEAWRDFFLVLTVGLRWGFRDELEWMTGGALLRGELNLFAAMPPR